MKIEKLLEFFEKTNRKCESTIKLAKRELRYRNGLPRAAARENQAKEEPKAGLKRKDRITPSKYPNLK